MVMVVYCALDADPMVRERENSASPISLSSLRHLGKIYGEAISRKEEDNLRCIIDEILKRMHPFVSPSRYRSKYYNVIS